MDYTYLFVTEGEEKSEEVKEEAPVEEATPKVEATSEPPADDSAAQTAADAPTIQGMC